MSRPIDHDDATPTPHPRASTRRSSAPATHCDRFTATVLASRFRYIVEHMSRGLLTQRLLADHPRLVRLRGDALRARREPTTRCRR